MIRGLLKLLLVIVVIVGIGAFLVGRRSTVWEIFPGSSVGAKGPGPVDSNKARDAGAKVGEAAGNAANKASRALEGTAMTAKIKSKMALDDLVKARNIHVD